VRGRVGLLVSLAIVASVSLATYAPRVGHRFPSMVDDWHAIADGPDWLREVLLLGNPETVRYRPGFVIWNTLQWHTLGAPTDLVGPQVWGLARWGLLVVGVTLLAALLVRSAPRQAAPIATWSLVVGAGLVAVTAPGIVVELARFGPQEPVMVGAMALGAVLLVRAVDRLLEPSTARATTVTLVVGGLAAWSLGVLQKESSACVLLLAPFLWPTVRSQSPRWAGLGRRRRTQLVVVAGAVLLPFAPMLARMLELRLRGRRVYEEAVAASSFTERLSDQLSDASDMLHTEVVWILLGAAFVLLTVTLIRVGADWLSIGLVVVALAFMAFAATSGVVAGRYYLPVVTLLALAVARLATSLGSSAVAVAVASLMIVGGAQQAYEAHGFVEAWVESERAHETLVREAAARSGGGCAVAVTGLNVEYVEALPVLVPLADERAHACEPGSKYLVVLDYGAPGDETPVDDPILVACAPDPNPVWSSLLGKIFRCTRWGAAASAASLRA
jgi:hypothetical protein